MANQVNVATLARLADKDVEAQATDFGALPLDIRQSLQTLAAERNKQITEAAASEILDLLQIKDAFITSVAQNIIALKAQVKAQEELGAKIARQVAFGNATLNYLPLARQLGQPMPLGTKAVLEVPKEWVAPAQAAA